MRWRVGVGCDGCGDVGNCDILCVDEEAVNRQHADGGGDGWLARVASCFEQ